MRVPKEVKKAYLGEIWTPEPNWDLVESSNTVRKVVLEQICILK